MLTNTALVGPGNWLVGTEHSMGHGQIATPPSYRLGFPDKLIRPLSSCSKKIAGRHCEHQLRRQSLRHATEAVTIATVRYLALTETANNIVLMIQQEHDQQVY